MSCGHPEYFPRSTFDALPGQYFRFGRGRAATAVKHPDSLRGRHFILISLVPAAVLARFVPLYPAFLSPILDWFVACTCVGPAVAVRDRDPSILACGRAAGITQISWASGFWGRLLQGRAALPFRRLPDVHPELPKGAKQ